MSGGNNDFQTLFNDEFIALTKIGNNYRIRHHETDKVDITDDNYYDYFFNRFQSEQKQISTRKTVHIPFFCGVNV